MPIATVAMLSVDDHGSRAVNPDRYHAVARDLVRKASEPFSGSLLRAWRDVRTNLPLVKNIATRSYSVGFALAVMLSRERSTIAQSTLRSRPTCAATEPQQNMDTVKSKSCVDCLRE